MMRERETEGERERVSDRVRKRERYIFLINKNMTLYDEIKIKF